MRQMKILKVKISVTAKLKSLQYYLESFSYFYLGGARARLLDLDVQSQPKFRNAFTLDWLETRAKINPIIDINFHFDGVKFA